jgi:hypothetical protein
MPTYILQFPGSDFTGFRGGVDFYGGRGSTSSKADANLLVSKLGCLIVEPASEIKTEGAPAGALSATSTPEDEPRRVFVNKADREAHEKLVQRLAGNESRTGVRKGGRKK